MKLNERGDSVPWLWLSVLLGVFIAGGYVDQVMPEHPERFDGLSDRNPSTSSGRTDVNHAD